MNIKDIYNNHEGLSVPSLNKETLKVEWKPIIASMKRSSSVIEVSISQTGNAKGNNLRLTPDHKMITLENGVLAAKEIIHLLKDEQMLSLIHKLPALDNSTIREQKLAYLLGALWTDGSIYQSNTHGEVQFIQKPIPEKEKFISEVKSSMKQSFNYDFHVCHKKMSSGFIRGKPAIGAANAYRCYSKLIAREIQLEKESYVKTLLCADEELVYSFLAGVIDGDGTYNQNSNKINIYCSNKLLLEAIVVSCLRIGILPQISTNRSIFNVQIVENIPQIFRYTKRVKGTCDRKVQGTRFFSARQLLTDSMKSKFSRHLQENLLIDAEKLRRLADNNLSLKKILDSDIRMNRVNFVRELETQDVYNITIADNHNYIVFTDRLYPVLVNNCHAAIISRELGIPCIVGTNNCTEKIKPGQKITLDCSSGEEGMVYDGMLKYSVEEIDLTKLPKTKTKIMMNVGNPDEAFELSFMPNEGVGLAREEFIINSYIKVHPMALINFDKITDNHVKDKIEQLTYGYDDKKEFFVDKLAQGIGTIAAAFYPKKVILRFSDFKTNEYANLLGGADYEPKEENPMIGWRGASRYYKDGYRKGFALECQAINKVREEFGLTNLEVMIPICRTVAEGKKVLAEMEKNGLKRAGKNSLKVNVMCEVPANAILADEFLDVFDGFSIGSNDLTQFTLACDRDSALVADIYDERNEAVKKLIENAISVANKKAKYIGICGDAPSTFPDFAQFLVRAGIHSMSLSPDALVKTTLAVAKVEKGLKMN
jgi:pyruvate,water dikinase